MSKYSFWNYSSQEYSPGDIDPVSNHPVVEVDDRGNITGRAPYARGGLSEFALERFGSFVEAGNVPGFYEYYASFGSPYGKQGFAYHNDAFDFPDDIKALISDMWSFARSGGKFRECLPVYDLVAQGIVERLYEYMQESGALPVASEIYPAHKGALAERGLSEIWIGDGLVGGLFVDIILGKEPGDERLLGRNNPRPSNSNDIYRGMTISERTQLSNNQSSPVIEIKSNSGQIYSPTLGDIYNMRSGAVIIDGNNTGLSREPQRP